MIDVRFCLKTFGKLTQRSFSKGTVSTMNNMISNATNIYQSSVRAVQPETLINHTVQRESNVLKIQGKQFIVDKNVYIVGFGKAVLGMAASLMKILNDHIISGILSVPYGIRKDILCHKLISSKIEVLEGALNNIPDQKSLSAANKILELASSLEESSFLIVLISGGGSALLPSPIFPLTLEEKQNIIKILFSRGATIEEINVIRKKLSLLKGGGLAQLAAPAKVVSLILSDIIRDPIDLIASGPTVRNSDDPHLPISIVEKYKIKDLIPPPILKLLEGNPTGRAEKQTFEHVSNFIIGNNTIALNAAAEKATELRYHSVIMTNEVCGLATDVAENIIRLVDAASLNDRETVFDICNKLNIVEEKGVLLLDEFKNLDDNEGLCILFGGETTVKVTGSGIGGRNQELALSASLELYNRKRENKVILLSAGTDGIDGPTDVAGAIAMSSIVHEANKKGMDAEKFLQNNDSYSFYNSVNNGLWHVKIGHTGTNVMDVIIVLVEK